MKPMKLISISLTIITKELITHEEAVIISEEEENPRRFDTGFELGKREICDFTDFRTVYQILMLMWLLESSFIYRTSFCNRTDDYKIFINSGNRRRSRSHHTWSSTTLPYYSANGVNNYFIISSEIHCLHEKILKFHSQGVIYLLTKGNISKFPHGSKEIY